MTDDEETPYLRVRDAAKYLAISPRSLADPSFRKKHSIPTLRIGRVVVFNAIDLAQWLNSKTASSRAASHG